MDRNPGTSPAVQAAAWRSQQNFLLAAAFIMPLTFSVWQALLNNFVIERAAFTGAEIGILQSLREIPGFLAFSAVFLIGSAIATASLLLCNLIPRHPQPGNETLLSYRGIGRQV